jgi:hypothetical protein
LVGFEPSAWKDGMAMDFGVKILESRSDTTNAHEKRDVQKVEISKTTLRMLPAISRGNLHTFSAGLYFWIT